MQDFEAMCAADLGRQITDELRLKRRESSCTSRDVMRDLGGKLRRHRQRLRLLRVASRRVASKLIV
jgi:hypothetical protein